MKLTLSKVMFGTGENLYTFIDQRGEKKDLEMNAVCNLLWMN